MHAPALSVNITFNSVPPNPAWISSRSLPITKTSAAFESTSRVVDFFVVGTIDAKRTSFDSTRSRLSLVA
jgi:hypothetical protein